MVAAVDPTMQLVTTNPRELMLATAMSCSSADFLGWDSYNITVEFDYELAVMNPNELSVEVMQQDVPFLKYSVLYLLAQAINIRPCDLASQSLALSTNATVTGLENLEPDTLDTDVCE